MRILTCLVLPLVAMCGCASFDRVANQKAVADTYISSDRNSSVFIRDKYVSVRIRPNTGREILLERMPFEVITYSDRLDLSRSISLIEQNESNIRFQFGVPNRARELYVQMPHSSYRMPRMYIDSDRMICIIQGEKASEVVTLHKMSNAN